MTLNNGLFKTFLSWLWNFVWTDFEATIALSGINTLISRKTIFKCLVKFIVDRENIYNNGDTTNLDPSIQSRETMIALSWITEWYYISYNSDTTNLDPSFQSRETMIALSWISAQLHSEKIQKSWMMMQSIILEFKNPNSQDLNSVCSGGSIG